MTKLLYIGLTALFAIFVFLLGKAYVLEQQASSTNSIVDSPFEPSVSTPSPQVAGENIVLPPNTGSDPIVTCNFKYLAPKKMKSSECSKSFECQVGERWYIYTSREKCKQDQEQNWVNPYAGESSFADYVNCTIYYPALGYSSTYYIDAETCDAWKADEQKSIQDYNARQQVGTSSPPTQDSSNYKAYCDKTAKEIETNLYGTYGNTPLAQGLAQEALKGYSSCLQTGVWPGSSIKISEPTPTTEPNYEGTIVY